MDNPQRSLELTRQRITQLVHALNSFQNILHQPTESLPPWQTLQSHFNVLSSTLDSLASTLHSHFPSFPSTRGDQPNTLVSYPLPSFPGNTQEIALNSLLTKKPLPEVREEQAELALSEDAKKDEGREELWNVAWEICVEEMEKREWGEEGLAEADGKGSVGKGIGGGAAGGGAGEKEEKEREQRELIGGLRFMLTGVPIERQTQLPAARVVGKK